MVEALKLPMAKRPAEPSGCTENWPDQLKRSPASVVPSKL